MSPVPDCTIDGKLKLVRKLGQGAHAEVWLARHLKLGSQVAVKLLGPGAAADPTAQRRFVREARAIGRLRSPYIVQVFDYGM
ncbi:MAG: protein kinase, partial [Polyangiaceae bacterium]|nr:protein kinase [Polyangiaceae bacterium]